MRYRNLAIIATIILIIAYIFLLLHVWIMPDAIVHPLGPPSIYRVIGFIFSAWIIAPLVFILLLWRKKDGLLVGITIASVFIIDELLKFLIHRVRPENLYLTDYSFPSGHAAISASIGLLLIYYYKQPWIRALAIAIPIIVGFSRILLGVHWLSDVIAGWALGIAVTALILCVVPEYISRGLR